MSCASRISSSDDSEFEFVATREGESSSKDGIMEGWTLSNTSCRMFLARAWFGVKWVQRSGEWSEDTVLRNFTYSE